MSSKVLIPFNNNPSSVVPLTSSSYTVPVGKYARVDYKLVNGSLQINGTTIDCESGYSAATYASGSSSSVSSSELTLFTATSLTEGPFRVNCSWNNNSGISYSATFRHRRAGVIIGSIILTSASVGVSDYFSSYVLSGDTFTAQGPGIAYTRSIGLSSDSSLLAASCGKLKTLWLPSGSVITFTSALPVSVTGLIQLYNVVA